MSFILGTHDVVGLQASCQTRVWNDHYQRMKKKHHCDCSWSCDFTRPERRCSHSDEWPYHHCHQSWSSSDHHRDGGLIRVPKIDLDRSYLEGTLGAPPYGRGHSKIFFMRRNEEGPNILLLSCHLVGTSCCLCIVMSLVVVVALQIFDPPATLPPSLLLFTDVWSRDGALKSWEPRMHKPKIKSTCTSVFWRWEPSL